MGHKQMIEEEKKLADPSLKHTKSSKPASKPSGIHTKAAPALEKGKSEPVGLLVVKKGARKTRGRR